ncbi:MAG: tRNA (adenosine(37)-N6)-threonylcarbamoyltransferase complex ATPase subunit type 1 TsaE [Burkholderiales bacterium]|nr:tRNA (adenosine(37)-N6)-threonylcarbamoyltransferase complex ATPase subunit type 1 TsaE [Burkholderiales bacterium]
MQLRRFRCDLPDPPATEAAGAALAGALTGGMLVTLSGPLGAGKTTLVRGVLRALGWAGPVKSPSYALLEHYPFSNIYLYHFDFYRFADPAEWENLGAAECFTPQSVCLVEWPERVAGLLPAADLEVRLAPSAGGDGRTLELSATTTAGERCMNAIEAALAASPPCASR